MGLGLGMNLGDCLRAGSGGNSEGTLLGEMRETGQLRGWMKRHLENQGQEHQHRG